jgi:AbrB family looped-hinge helix DNA binding protein
MPSKLSVTDRRQMATIVRDLATKAAKIRALDAAGFARARIAEYLGIRYQHVRNVLTRSGSAGLVRPVSTTIGPGGRIVIPAPYRQALGLNEGDQVMLSLVDDEVRLTSRLAKIREAQELLSRYVPQEVSLVDELIAERRREGAGDDKVG